MNKIMTWLKSIRLARIVTIFMAGILLFVSTACGGSKVLAKTADDARQEVPGKAVTNTYKGGMNDYEDVDPRRDTSEAKAKAKALIENAQKNVDEKSINSPEDYAENYRSGTPLGERTRRLGEDIGSSAKNTAEDVAEGTKRGLENIKENAQGTPGYVKQTGKETAKLEFEEAQTKANNSIKSSQQALDTAGDASRNIGSKIQDSARDAADAVKSKVNRDIGRTQQALKDAADSID